MIIRGWSQVFLSESTPLCAFVESEVVGEIRRSTSRGIISNPLGRRKSKTRWRYQRPIYDVTHLVCRSARDTPAAGGGSCSPVKAQKAGFPGATGGAMLPVEDCTKQDYAMLIEIGVGAED